MLLCKIVNYFVSMNMLVFPDVAESKQFESIVPMADGSVETVDVDGCLKGPILKVDVATDTDDLVTQVDQACCTDDLILQVDAACDASGLISTETIPIPGPSTNSTIEQKSRVKPDPMTAQEQNRVKPDPTCRIRVYNGRIHIVPLDSPSLGYLCK